MFVGMCFYLCNVSFEECVNKENSGHSELVNKPGRVKVRFKPRLDLYVNEIN